MKGSADAVGMTPKAFDPGSVQMERVKRLATGAALTIVLAWAGPMQAAEVDVPAKAIAGEVAMVVWGDGEALSAEAIRASARSVASLVPARMADAREQMVADVEAAAQEIGQSIDALAGAGGRGILFVTQGTPPGTAKPMALIQTEPGATLEAVSAALRQASPRHGARGEAVVYADRWVRIAEAGSTHIEDGHEAHAATFRELLRATGEAPVRIVFRMTEQVKQDLRNHAAGDALTTGLVQVTDSLETGWVTLAFGADPTITARLNFADAEAARAFEQAWERLRVAREGHVIDQLRHVPDAADRLPVQSLFESLKMQQDEASLSLTLDKAFFGQAAECAMQIPLWRLVSGADLRAVGENAGGRRR